MTPTTCDCYGGPLDGELAWWKGNQISHAIGPIFHVYRVCERGHYHYQGAEVAPDHREKEVGP